MCEPSRDESEVGSRRLATRRGPFADRWLNYGVQSQIRVARGLLTMNALVTAANAGVMPVVGMPSQNNPARPVWRAATEGSRAVLEFCRFNQSFSAHQLPLDRPG